MKNVMQVKSNFQIPVYLNYPQLFKVKIVEYSVFTYFYENGTIFKILSEIKHRGLKLDGAIGQGKICNSLKSEKFSKSFLSHIGKNKIKF